MGLGLHIQHIKFSEKGGCMVVAARRGRPRGAHLDAEIRTTANIVPSSLTNYRAHRSIGFSHYAHVQHSIFNMGANIVQVHKLN